MMAAVRALLRKMCIRLISRVAALLLLPGMAFAADTWATHTGDDARWSRPEFNDSTWSRVPVESTWRELGLQGYDGMVWFRRDVKVGEQNNPALLLGPPVYGGYEAYAGGHLLGRSRGWSSALPFAFAEVFRVPRD